MGEAGRHQAPSPVQRGASEGTSTSARVQRFAERFRARNGLKDGEFIPGYDPCKSKSKSKSKARADKAGGPAGKGCSDGLLCISPLPNTPGDVPPCPCPWLNRQIWPFRRIPV